MDSHEDLPFVDESPGDGPPVECPASGVTLARRSPPTNERKQEQQERDGQHDGPLTFVEQICQLPGASVDQVDTAVPFYVAEPATGANPPEILVAYMSGQPEAVQAIELLREAQRVWDQRKRSPSPPPPVQPAVSSLQLPVHRREQRRYSHEDLRIPKASETSSSNKVASCALNTHTKPQHHHRRRPSTQAECLGSHAHRYQKNPAAGRKRPSLRPESESSPPSSVQKKEMTARLRSARGSVDVVSQAMMTAGMNAGAYMHSRRSSSLPESACLKVGDAAAAASAASSGAGSRRPSHHRAALDADGQLPLGTDAASFYKEQRRRASSRASAIFLVSPSSKETQLVPEDEDDGTPEGRRRRRTISIIATVGAFLLVLSILLVTITLRLATHIDDLVRKENEQQTSVASSSSGVELAMFNVTTPATPSAALPNATTSTLSSLSAAMFNVTKPSGAT